MTKPPDILKKYLDVLDENMDILSDLESALDDENENELTSDMKLHQLYDMGPFLVHDLTDLVYREVHLEMTKQSSLNCIN